MKAYLAFTKKEFTESIRTYKLLILLVVFIAFGILAPLTAKLTPQLLAMLVPENMEISLGVPTALDSWTQFYKNMTGIQLIVLVVVLGGILTGELSKGTLINMLTKGLGRTTVISSKFTAAALLWTLCYGICFGVCYGYTVYIFPENSLPGIFIAAFSLWLYGILLIAALIFFSVVITSTYGVLLLMGGFAVVLMLLSVVPSTAAWNPYLLAGGNMQLLTGELVGGDFLVPCIVGACLTAVFFAVAVVLFKRKQI